MGVAKIWPHREKDVRKLMEKLGFEPHEMEVVPDWGETEDGLTAGVGSFEYIQVGFPEGKRSNEADVFLAVPDPFDSQLSTGVWYECDKRQTEMLITLFVLSITPPMPETQLRPGDVFVIKPLPVLFFNCWLFRGGRQVPKSGSRDFWCLVGNQKEEISINVRNIAFFCGLEAKEVESEQEGVVKYRFEAPG